MEIIKKRFDFEIKQVGEEKDRVLRFCGSDESPDRDNDVIEVAGWKTDDYMKNPIVLWSHNGYSAPPIGKTINIDVDRVKKRLMFDIKFPTLEEMSSDVENPSEHAKFVDTIYNMCKNKYLNATSVGFRGIKFKTRDDPEVLEKPEWQRGRRYLEQSLHEISICSVPANPNALQAAKSMGLDEMTIKSFFDAKNEEPWAEDASKTGARLSKETIEAMKGIMGKMSSALVVHATAHKEAMKSYKSCMDEWKNLAGVSDGVMDPANPGTSDGVESPKSSDPDILKAIADLTEKVEKLMAQKTETPPEATKADEFDLDAIEFSTAEKNAEKDELPATSDELKTMFEEILAKKLNAVMGKID